MAWYRAKQGKLMPCTTCKKAVYVYPSEMSKAKHFCARTCQTLWKRTHGKEINQHLSKRISKACEYCKRTFIVHAYRSETARFCSNSCKGHAFPEELHSSWKGDNVGYSGIHVWIKKHNGRASARKCAFCKNQAQHWANIDGKYRRKKEDYISLCASCHSRYDFHMRGHGTKHGGGSILSRFG